MAHIKYREVEKIVYEEIIEASGNGKTKPKQYLYNCCRRLQDSINELCGKAWDEGGLHELKRFNVDDDHNVPGFSINKRIAELQQAINQAEGN
jgi:hypothetical protein